MAVTLAAIVLSAGQFAPSHGWAAGVERPSPTGHRASFGVHRGRSRLRPRASAKGAPLVEPDNQFGRMAYWDESYRQSLVEGGGGEGKDNGKEGGAAGTETFSWYCGWEDELAPFFSELVPSDGDPKVLVPGIGNDPCIRDLFDAGYRRLTAFDYAPEGVECARRMFGPERVRSIDDLRVADARDLPYDDAAYDAALDKGTLDSIYLSGGMDKELARKHLGMAVSELARVLKVGGIAFSVTAACADAVQQSFDDCNEERGCWRQVRDGELYMTEDGYASNNVDATMLVFERI